MHSVESTTVATVTECMDLITVTVRTSLGAVYVFPDVSEEQLKLALPESGRVPGGYSQLMFMNTSLALLSVPWRVVEEVKTARAEVEEVVWSR